MKYVLIIISLLTLILVILIIEALIAFFNGRESFENPPREYEALGENGKNLIYLVMGDSTTAGQGGTYSNGIAFSTARHLADDYQVKMFNTSISGSTVGDLISNQLSTGIKTNPDVVLISIGANDTTHLITLSTLEKNLSIVVEKLIEKNCNVKIVFTGAPDMGSIKRFMQPLRYLAGLQTKRVNKVFKKIVDKYDLTFAAIAAETGVEFRNNPSLFAEDKFHPNDKGYKIWIPVINSSLNEALGNQPNHCK